MSEHQPMHIMIYIDDRRIGQHCIEDPFHTTTVVIGWPDLLRAILRRSLTVKVRLSTHDRRFLQQVMHLCQDYEPSDEPARPGGPLAAGGTDGGDHA